jgi:hypothetical protein
MEKDINEIIVKSLSGRKLNADEQELKNQWMDKASNKGFYNKLHHYRKGTQNVASDKRMDVNLAYQKHLEYLSVAKSTKRKLIINRLLPYAAMIVVMAGVFSLMMYLGNDTALKPDQQWLSSIEPGSQKAELILADGKVVDLEKENEKALIKEQDGTLISNTGTSLVYDVSSKTKSVEIAYNSLVVPRGGEYELVLEDGTKVKVNSETRLRYPTQFSDNERVVLLEGEAYFDVSKDQNRPFIVRTQGVDVRVLGTSFNVSSYPDEEAIRTTLVEGSVAVMDRNNQVENVLLKPGYQAIYSKDDKKLTAEKVNVELFTSWKDGRFVFEKSYLDDIMTKVSRWYDVKVFYQNNNVNTIRFTGSLKRYDSLDRLLKMIEKTNEVRFVLGDKTIQVEQVFFKK